MQKIQKIDDVISDMTKIINFEEYSNKFSDITFPISKETLKNIKLTLKNDIDNNKVNNNNMNDVFISNVLTKDYNNDETIKNISIEFSDSSDPLNKLPKKAPTDKANNFDDGFTMVSENDNRLYKVIKSTNSKNKRWVLVR